MGETIANQETARGLKRANCHLGGLGVGTRVRRPPGKRSSTVKADLLFLSRKFLGDPLIRSAQAQNAVPDTSLTETNRLSPGDLVVACWITAFGPDIWAMRVVTAGRCRPRMLAAE